MPKFATFLLAAAIGLAVYTLSRSAVRKSYAVSVENAYRQALAAGK